MNETEIQLWIYDYDVIDLKSILYVWCMTYG